MMANPRTTATALTTAGDVDADERENGLDQLGDIRLAHPAQGQAGHRHAKLRGGEVGVQVLRDMPGKNGPAVALLDEGVQAGSNGFLRSRTPR